MQEQKIRVYRFFGLKLARSIFWLLTLIGVFLCILTLVIVILEATGNSIRGATSGLSQSFGDLLFRTLLFYTAYQLIDVVLSINDNLRKLVRPGYESARELQQIAEEMAGQTKKVNVLLEQHHRRLDRLESKE